MKSRVGRRGWLSLAFATLAVLAFGGSAAAAAATPRISFSFTGGVEQSCGSGSPGGSFWGCDWGPSLEILDDRTGNSEIIESENGLPGVQVDRPLPNSEVVYTPSPGPHDYDAEGRDVGEVFTFNDLDSPSTRILHFAFGYDPDRFGGNHSPVQITATITDPDGARRIVQLTLTPNQPCVQVSSSPAAYTNQAVCGSELELNHSPGHGNGAPCASPDAYSVAPGGTLKVGAAEGLLANDFDPDQEALHVVLRRISFGRSKLKLDEGSGALTFRAGGKTGRASISYQAVDAAGARSQVAVATIWIGSPSRDPSQAACARGRGLRGVGGFIGSKRFSKSEAETFRDGKGSLSLTLDVSLTAFRWANHVEIKGAASVRASTKVRHLCLANVWTIYTQQGESSLRPVSPWEGDGFPFMIDYTGGRPTKNGTDWYFRGPSLEKSNASYLGIGFSETKGVLSWDSIERRIGDVHLAVAGMAGAQAGCGGNHFAVSWHR